MVNWIGNFLSARTEPKVLDKAADPAASVGAGSTSAPLDIGALYLNWLFGADVSQAANPALENAVLFALKRQVQSEVFDTHLVPRRPSVLPDLMKSLHDRNASGKELARQIGRDASLIAEVIKEANSPYYHPVDRITNLDKAVMLLGNRGVRMVVAKSYLRPVINVDSSALARSIAPKLWEQSERCAMACCLLSDAYRVDPFDAFLAGLLKNLGLTVVLRIMSPLTNEARMPGHDSFFEEVDACAKKLSIEIAKLWEMPETIVRALVEIGQPAMAAHARTPMGKTLYVGNRLSELALMIENGQVTESVVEKGGLSELEMSCYQKIRQGKTEQA